MHIVYCGAYCAAIIIHNLLRRAIASERHQTEVGTSPEWGGWKLQLCVASTNCNDKNYRIKIMLVIQRRTSPSNKTHTIAKCSH